MKNQNTKIRIKDIATLSGVSEGTVDRVLHNRGEVSEKSRDAVRKVLEEINYSPNLLARSLASKKNYCFAYLIPQHLKNDYWEKVERGFDQASNDFLQYNIHLEKFYFNQFDSNSFAIVSSELIDTNPDAVIMAPIFKDESMNFCRQLKERQIPFSFIDSVIAEVDYLSYYGQNSFQSGYIAAKLLFQSVPDNAQVIFIRNKRKGAVSNQTLTRKAGFMHYIQEKMLTNIELINLELTDENEDENRDALKLVFEKYNNIKAAITFNSKAYRLAMHLQNLKHSDVQLIGYDLLEENLKYLKQDVISYLIAQRPEKQAYLSVRDLCSVLVFKQEINKNNYVPMDILMKENIEDYLLFGE